MISVQVCRLSVCFDFRLTNIVQLSIWKPILLPVSISSTTDYGRPEKKQPSLHGRKFTPTPKFLGMAAAYFVCHIGPIFLIFLIYALIECPQSLIKTNTVHGSATQVTPLANLGSLAYDFCVILTCILEKKVDLMLVNDLLYHRTYQWENENLLICHDNQQNPCQWETPCTMFINQRQG